MASSVPGDSNPVETRVDVMMRLLGVDLGAVSASRIATHYVKAVRTCKKCARGQSCRKQAVPGFASSLEPDLCPNAELLMQLMFEALPRPDDNRLH